MKNNTRYYTVLLLLLTRV